LGFSSTTTLVNSLDGGQTPIQNLLNNPFPSGIQQPTGSTLGPLTFAGQGFTQWNPYYKMPRAHQVFSGFQYLVAMNSSIDLSHVGKRNTAYSGNLNLNLPGWDFGKQCDMTSGGKLAYCNGLVANPFAGIAPLRDDPFFGCQHYAFRFQPSVPGVRQHHGV